MARVSAWGQLNDDVMSGAMAMQSMALSEISKAYNPNPEPQEWAYEEFMREAQECGHKWGQECSCPLCTKLSPTFQTMVQQVMAMAQEQNAGPQ